jgi:ATP-binding cassette, subfamily B, bacterial
MSLKVVSEELSRVRKKVRRVWRNGVNFSHILRLFWPHMQKHRTKLVLAFIFTLGYTMVGLLEPWPLKFILDTVILGKPLPSFLESALDPIIGDRMLVLYMLVATIVSLAILKGLLYYNREVRTAFVGQRVTADVRQSLYAHVQGLSFNFHERRRTGDVVTRLISDIRMLRTVLISLPETLVSQSFLLLGMTVVMFLLDWRLTLLALTVFPVLAIITRIYQGPMKQAVRKQREREGHLATIASEALGAYRVIQGTSTERHEIDRFGTENNRSLRSGLRATRLEAKFAWATDIVVGIGTAAIIVVAGQRVLSGALSPGDLLVFVLYLRTFFRPLRRLSRTAEQIARGTAAGERVADLMAVRPMVTDLPKARTAPRFRGEIEFDAVSFGYRYSTPVLHNINLKIQAGERLAIIGPTGSGKTSMVNLIPRFYDPTRGTVRIDGRDVQKFKITSLRSQIGLVFQEPVLFATTVAENIAYGMPIERNEIEAAAKQVGIDSIVDALPDGYDTVLGERGGTLSGGQRQCIAIARAFIRNPSIVILDEPTVGLDESSATTVLQAIRRLMEGRTVVTISHQLWSVDDVDRMVILRNGSIVADRPPTFKHRILAHVSQRLTEEVQK